MSWTNENGDPIAGPTAGNDVFNGTGGADSANGGAGDDQLYGEAGNDTLEGGEGYDQVSGGAGSDSITDTGGGYIDGGDNNDTISVEIDDPDDYNQPYLVGGNGDDRIIVTGPGVGANYYGVAYGAYVTAGAGNDTVSGSEGNDQFAGDAGNDSLLGNGGDDDITGGTGTDTILGGEGDDSVRADGGGDSLDGGAGTDALFLNTTAVATAKSFIVGDGGSLASNDGTIAVNFETHSFSTGSGNDTVVGGDGNDVVNAGGGADSVVGGGGDDQLNGEVGDDTLEGGDGYDNIYGGAGNDSITDIGAGAIFGGDNNDTIAVEIDAPDDYNQPYIDGGSGDDRIIVTGPGVGANYYGVAYGAYVTAGAGNDTVSGSEGNEQITGGAGNDSLLGNGGDDYIEGGTGTDTILGGDGDDGVRADGGGDSLDGGDGTDTLTLDTSPLSAARSFIVGSDGVLTGNEGTTAVNFENFTLTTGSGNDTLVGGDGNDVLTVGSGDDTVFGGAGDDQLYGNAGNDTLIGGEGFDRILGEAGADSITDTGTGFIDGGDDNDTITVVIDDPDDLNQAVIYGGSGDDRIIVTGQGTGLDYYGVAYGAYVTGDAGNDTISGSDGDDVIDGGTGNDSLLGNGGDDIIRGGDGIDTLSYEAAGSPVSAALFNGGGTVSIGESEIDGVSDIERITGSSLGDSISASWSSNVAGTALDGGGGDDTLTALGVGATSLIGGEGNDSLTGSTGDDTILGGEGDDYVRGGGGNDSIVATPGKDTVEGNAGNDSIETGDDDDLVIWRAGDGNDTIDLGAGHDTLDIQGWGSGAWSFGVDGSTATYTSDASLGNAMLTVLNYEASDTVVCFAEGTRIMTARGEVPVEQVRAGEMVLTQGAGAPLKPVRWVGHRRIDITRHRSPAAVAPVLVRAGALGEGVPHRDLRVSPEHGFLLDGHLVPARVLIDGETIVQETWQRSITYWHVELEQHGLLVAEGALAESYFDDGNRHFFGDAAVVALNPDFAAERDPVGYAAGACAPVLSAGDPALLSLRLRLLARAPERPRRRA